ncbi:DUF4333 domain-containing protein [Saccharomonospora sp.]|uniref:DUF4333 domain-containing protein n=1 Tax=Saccharomonospora sp. TaxID=33913 RepID=UPI002610E8A6|nr:DUF4333 domain-containing protein [Saccharomonospora sp.]
MRVRGVWRGFISICAVLALGACAGGDGDTEPAEQGTIPVNPTSIRTTSTELSESPTPVTKALNGASVEKSVRVVLTGSYGISDVDKVSCPLRPTVRKGATFDCTAVIEGENKRVPIEIVDDDGLYEVGLPV